MSCISGALMNKKLCTIPLFILALHLHLFSVIFLILIYCLFDATLEPKKRMENKKQRKMNKVSTRERFDLVV